MCTVTYYRNTQGTIITSNRDEHIDRPLANAPGKNVFDNCVLYYPTDPVASGTWFGVKNNGNTYVLLNGADKKHVSNPPYRMSRGLVLLDIMKHDYPLQCWNGIDLLNIEPFTIIVSTPQLLHQLRWNGNIKQQINLDPNQYHIWSSATLYSDEIIHQREQWFFTFLQNKNYSLTSKDLIDFHTNTHKMDKQNGLIINRNQTLLTKNVTQSSVANGGFTITHFDLIKDTKSIISDRIV